MGVVIKIASLWCMINYLVTFRILAAIFRHENFPVFFRISGYFSSKLVVFEFNVNLDKNLGVRSKGVGLGSTIKT